MKFNLNTNIGLLKSLGWVLAGVLVFLSIGFAKKEQREKICQGVIIHISNQHDNYFIDEEDIMYLATLGGTLPIVGKVLESLDLRALELNLESEKFIQDAQIYKDLRGNVVIHAKQRRPIARIIRPNGPDAYIGENGTILPVSEKFTARVMLISGEFTDSLVETGLVSKAHEPYMDLIEKIHNDPFWKAQIAQIDIDKKGNINIYTQVSKQVVEFGTINDIEKKFKKLEIFYKRILPFKGWNSYSRVSLKYLNQIVCE